MKKSIKWISVIAIIGIFIYFISPTLFGSKKTDGAPSSSGPPFASKIPVSAVLVKTKKVDDKITVTGSISPNESVELKSEISGRIEAIYFKEGSRVRKGDLLVSINDDELVAQLERLQYQQKLLSESEYRQSQLLAKEAISQEEYDIALTELKTAGADLKLVEAQLAKTKLRAPFSGIIGLRFVSEGSYITPTQPIAYLFSNDPAKVDFSIPGKYSSRVKVNDQIRFTTDALNDYKTGKIYAIEPQVDPNTRTLKMRAVSPNKENLLLPGQFTRIELVFDSFDNAIMIPTEAVIPELGGHKVYVKKAGKAESQKIEIGLRTEREVEVISGLTPSDTLITSGVLQLRPGADISVTLTN